MLLMGLTTYAFECVICHMSKQESLLGSENMQLDDTLDKASEYGPQYVQRNGATFVIQRYQTPTQPVGLPIR